MVVPPTTLPLMERPPSNHPAHYHEKLRVDVRCVLVPIQCAIGVDGWRDFNLRVEVHTPCSYPLASVMSNPLYKGYITVYTPFGERNWYEHQPLRVHL